MTNAPTVIGLVSCYLSFAIKLHRRHYRAVSVCRQTIAIVVERPELWRSERRQLYDDLIGSLVRSAIATLSGAQCTAPHPHVICGADRRGGSAHQRLDVRYWRRSRSLAITRSVTARQPTSQSLLRYPSQAHALVDALAFCEVSGVICVSAVPVATDSEARNKR